MLLEKLMWYEQCSDKYREMIWYMHTDIFTQPYMHTYTYIFRHVCIHLHIHGHRHTHIQIMNVVRHNILQDAMIHHSQHGHGSGGESYDWFSCQNRTVCHRGRTLNPKLLDSTANIHQRIEGIIWHTSHDRALGLKNVWYVPPHHWAICY